MRRSVAAISLALLLGACGRATHHSAATWSPRPTPTITPLSLASPRSAPPQAPPAQVPPPSPFAALATAEPTRSPAPAPFAPNEAFALSQLRPEPVATPVVRFSTLPPIPTPSADASPVIVDVLLPDATVTGGESVTGDVIASSNVQSVDVRVAGITRAMDRIAPGIFTLTVVVPRLPFFLRHRAYTLVVIARNAAGATATQSVSVRVR